MIFIGQSRMSFITADNFEIPYSMKVRYEGWNEKFIGMDFINYFFGKGLGYSGKVVDGMFAMMVIPTLFSTILLAPKVMREARRYFSEFQRSHH